MIMSQWLPLATSTFQTVVEIIPPPPVSQAIRLPKMLYPTSYQSHAEPKTRVERALYACDASAAAPLVVYVSKMFAVKTTDLPELRRVEVTADEMRERGRIERERRARERLLEEQLDKESLIGLGADGKGPSGTATPTEGEGAEGAPAAPTVAKSALAAPGIPLAPSPVPAPATNGQTPEEKSTIINLSGPKVLPAPAAGTTTLESETLLGFARLYSGTLTKGTALQVLLPKYNDTLPPTHPHNQKYITEVRPTHLYMMMGRDLIEVDRVPAGNVFAINGLEGRVMRNATMYASSAKGLAEGDLDSAQEDGWVNLAGIIMTVSTRPLNRRPIAGGLALTDVPPFQSAPIVRVALEPFSPVDLPKLVEGLRLLNQADPCVETLVQETGEHVILTAGELHLEVSPEQPSLVSELQQLILCHHLSCHSAVLRTCASASPGSRSRLRSPSCPSARRRSRASVSLGCMAGLVSPGLR
jgi:ribosome assembly protein 1